MGNNRLNGIYKRFETQQITKYINVFIIYLLVCSCAQKEACDILSRAESYMEVYPDSALLLLNQLPQPEILYGKQCADYALLLTQARDKNYLDSLQSDSLIKLAVDYYQDSDDKVKAGKALFYYGKVMALQDNDTIAMQAYLNAQTKLERTREYKLQALVQEYIGRINDDRGMFDLALDNYRKSIDYYQKAGDTLGAVYNCRYISWIYKIQQNSDSATWYLNSGISLLKGDSTSPILPSLLQMLGLLEKRNGDYPNAINKLLAAIKYEKMPSSIKHYYFSLGGVYMQIGQFEKARECFEQGLTSKKPFTQSGAYNYLYLLEKQKTNYTRALYYKEKSDSFLKIHQDENFSNQMLTIQRKYETKKLRMEKVLIEYEKQRLLYFWILVFSLLIVSGIFFYFWMKKQYRKIYKKRLKVHIRKALEVIGDNERVIGQYICQIEDLKQKEYIAARVAEQRMDSLNQRISELEIKNEESVKGKIAKLNQRIQMLVTENKAIRNDSCAVGIYVLEQLKKELLIVENMTQKEMSQVFEYMDLMFGGLVSHLRKEYGLNDNNLMLAILVKLNFTSVELMFVFQCEKNSIFKKKQRLRDKLGLKSDDELEKYLTSFPLYMST